jgi:hypothetical protein
MFSFATEFPVIQTHSSTIFFQVIRQWILGSPHTRFVANDLKQIEAQEEWSASKSNERIESLKIADANEEAVAVRYTKSDLELEWVTTIVFSRQRGDSWVGIRVSCESQHPAAHLPVAKKTILVRLLLDQLGGAFDGLLQVQAAPVRLDNIDIDIASQCISDRAGCRLPVVYVSSEFRGGHLVNVDSLAKTLAGMAHVLVEPNRPFSLRLMTEVDSQNVYGGTIGIYWPDGGGRRSFFIGPEFDHPDEIEQAIVHEVQTALANRRPQERCTWASVQEAISHRVFNSLKEQGSTEVSRYIEEFDKELKAKDERLIDAEKEISRLMAEVRRYEAKNPIRSGVTLRTGQEQDFYSNELVGIVLDALETSILQVPKDSRRQHILSAIIEANAFTSEAKSKREALKTLLRDFRGMDVRIKKGLGDLGFEVESDGKHHKLIFQGDDRYTFTLPKSGSDHRGGLNAANDISRLFF